VSRDLQNGEKLSSESAVITVDELEALRLHAIEALHQEQAASQMGVSRATYSRILKSCQAKIAKAILQGSSIEVDDAFWVVNSNKRKDIEKMKKIAVPVIADDGNLVVSEHFGKAPFFAVVELDGESIKETKLVENRHDAGCAGVVNILAQSGVNVLLVKGIGGRPKLACDSLGIGVYRAEGDTVSESVSCFLSGSKKHDTSCHGHDHDSEHGHGEGCHEH